MGTVQKIRRQVLWTTHGSQCRPGIPVDTSAPNFLDWLSIGTYHLNTFTFFCLTSYSYFQRTGETSFEYDQASNKLTLKANIGITDAKAGYDARAEFQGISVGASADAKISKVNIYFDAEMCLGEGCKLILKDFQISEIGHIDVSIHGLGPLDWILGI